MNAMPPAHTNGSKPVAPSDWLQRSVKQFFSDLNWENHSFEVQQIKQIVAQGNDTPLSLTLSVRQFFAAISWEDSIATSVSVAPRLPALEDAAFTLENFSDLF
jgi:hypothetical protein